MSFKTDELAALLAAEDHAGLHAAAATARGRVLRYLVGRLCSTDEAEKWRAVAALGSITADAVLVPHEQVVELVRRFLWALNDESGAVPFGIPEALAEVLVARPELQAEFVPILGSLLSSDEMSQTGPIERGVIWGLGRLGEVTAAHAPHAIDGLRTAAASHPDPLTRGVAQEALRRLEP